MKLETLMRGGTISLTLACLLATACSDTRDRDIDESRAPAVDSPSEFIRFVEDSDGSARLETAIVNYRDDQGRQVALVGALHIGDDAYFDELNHLFPHFDSVLYEIIAERGTVPDPANSGASAIGGVQHMMKDFMDLQFQLEQVDYTADNFVHADLDPESMARLMEERGESVLSIVLRMVLEGMAQSMNEGDEEAFAKAQADQWAMLLALFSGNSRSLKFALGRQFGDLEQVFAAMEDNDPSGKGSLLIGERNRAAMAVLSERLGDGDKRIAIYYGAGHMPDFERRLAREGFSKTTDTWLTAWNLAR